MQKYEMSRIASNEDGIVFRGDSSVSDLIEGTCYCTLSVHHALQIWPKVDWRRLCDLVPVLPKKNQKRLLPLSAFAARIEISNGAIRIPSYLVDRVGIKDVAFLCFTEMGEIFLVAAEFIETLDDADNDCYMNHIYSLL